MKKLIFSALVFCLSQTEFATKAIAQKNHKLTSIQLVSDFSVHGSGDMNGMLAGFEIVRQVKQRLALSYSFRSTIHSSKDEILIFNNSTGSKTDASIRYTTAGLQTGLNGQYSVIKNKRNDLSIGLGAFIRYQSASNGSDGYQLFYPSSTGQPSILIGYDNHTPQHTVALGALLQLSYNFYLSPKCYLGINGGLQTDTNGDLIRFAGINLGRTISF